MLFIDYVPLLLINMATGLCMLAYFVYAGLDALRTISDCGFRIAD